MLSLSVSKQNCERLSHDFELVGGPGARPAPEKRLQCPNYCTQLGILREVTAYNSSKLPINERKVQSGYRKQIMKEQLWREIKSILLDSPICFNPHPIYLFC